MGNMCCCCRRDVQINKKPQQRAQQQPQHPPEQITPSPPPPQQVQPLQSPQPSKRSISSREIAVIVQPEQPQLVLNQQETQSNNDDVRFEAAIESILEKNNEFNRNKNFIESQLTGSFGYDQINLDDQSNNQDFSGPKIKNKNICDIDQKFDFSKVNEFQEYNNKITIVRLIQKQKSPICTYIGKIEGKYCCVKLLPMANTAHVEAWIQKVKEVQKVTQDIAFKAFCQKYYYYKIERLQNNQNYCNCYIISNLELYNAYTFSHHPSVKLSEKVQVAYQVIQIIQTVLKSKINQNQENRLEQRLSTDIFKNMFTIKRNNMLIYKVKIDNQDIYKVWLSDWQLLLPEFENIIPNHKLQGEDKLFQDIEKNINDIIDLSNRSLAPQQPNQLINGKIQELEEFTKRVLKLIFFRVNFELFNDVELYGFQNVEQFNEICEKKIQILDESEKEIFRQLKENIISYSYRGQESISQMTDSHKQFQQKKSQQINNEFKLNHLHDQNYLYEIYLMILYLKGEPMRSALKELPIDHHLN